MCIALPHSNYIRERRVCLRPSLCADPAALCSRRVRTKARARHRQRRVRRLPSATPPHRTAGFAQFGVPSDINICTETHLDTADFFTNSSSAALTARVAQRAQSGRCQSDMSVVHVSVCLTVKGKCRRLST